MQERLLSESSGANTHSGGGILQRMEPQICYDSKVLKGEFPYKWSAEVNLQRAIHLNTAGCLPCTVTLQMPAEPSQPQIGFLLLLNNNLLQ